MRLSVKLFVAGSIGLVVLIIGSTTHWFGATSSTVREPQEIETISGTEQALPPRDAALPEPKIEPAPLLPGSNRSVTVPPAVAAAAAIPATWEKQLDEILSSSEDTAVQAKQFVALIPRLPVEGQVEAAQHAANLISDEAYADLGKILVDPATPETVVDVLLADLLDRPNNIKLPLLLQIAKTANHPGQMEAHEDLVFYLDEDFGIDWPKWEEKLGTWLKENPE